MGQSYLARSLHHHHLIHPCNLFNIYTYHFFKSSYSKPKTTMKSPDLEYIFHSHCLHHSRNLLRHLLWIVVRFDAHTFLVYVVMVLMTNATLIYNRPILIYAEAVCSISIRAMIHFAF